MNDSILNSWTVGEYEIREIKPWSSSKDARWFVYVIDGRVSDITYTSLDMALIEAVANKYTGSAKAHGPGTGSAGYWFARMIGMNVGE